jgi:hypothetical protein
MVVKIFLPPSIFPEVQIYWTVQNKSSQVTKNPRSVSAGAKLSIMTDSPLKTRWFVQSKQTMYMVKKTCHQRGVTIKVSEKSK